MSPIVVSMKCCINNETEVIGISVHVDIKVWGFLDVFFFYFWVHAEKHLCFIPVNNT